MSRHCFICGYGEVDTIPKIEKPSSGDTMVIIFAATASVIAIGAGVGIFLVVKKKKVN